MHIVLFGSPGVGKGTQAKRLRERKNWTIIATGDLLREAIAQGTALGLEAKSYIDKGELVPDSVVNGLAREQLSKITGGFALDGYPRNLTQAVQLDEWLSDLNKPIQKAILFELPEEELIKRLSGRRLCSQCGAVFHIESGPSQKGDLCDKCGGTLITRSDDEPETVKRRLGVYAEQTQPLVEYYERQGLLVRVSAEGSPDEVFERLVQALER